MVSVVIASFRGEKELALLARSTAGGGENGTIALLVLAMADDDAAAGR
jgi:hypothetical protein